MLFGVEAYQELSKKVEAALVAAFPDKPWYVVQEVLGDRGLLGFYIATEHNFRRGGKHVIVCRPMVLINDAWKLEARIDAICAAFEFVFTGQNEVFTLNPRCRGYIIGENSSAPITRL